MAILDVTTFGASIGGPSSTNRTSIQAAVDAAVSGDTVYLPGAGTYTVNEDPGSGTHAIRIAKSGITIAGDGKLVTTIAMDALEADDPDTSQIFKIELCTDVEVRDIGLHGNKPNSGTVTTYDPITEHHNGFFIGPGVARITLTNLYIHDFTGDGVQVYNNAATPVTDITIRGTLIKWCQRNGQTFSPNLFTTIERVLMENNEYTDNTVQPVDNEHGPVHDVEIRGCTFNTGINDYAIAISGYIDVIGHANRSKRWYLHDNNINGGIFAIRCEDVRIENNTFNNPTTKPSIDVWRLAYRLKIVNNTFVMTQTTAPSVPCIAMIGTNERDAGPTDVLIAKNTITQTGQHASCWGIRLEGATSVIVRDNDMTGPGVSAASFSGVSCRATIENRSVKRMIVDNNRITNYGQYGIAISGSGISKLLRARFTRNTFVNTAGPMTIAMDLGDSLKPAQHVQIGGNILGTGVTTEHVDSAQVAVLFESSLPANSAAGESRALAPLAPLLGQVVPKGVSVQQAGGEPYKYDTEAALIPLRQWTSTADLIREGLPAPETLYPMMEASGMHIDDVIKGTRLQVFTGFTGARVGQRAHGMFTGQDFHGRRCVEIGEAKTTNGKIEAANTTPHNYASTSFAVMIVFRSLMNPAATASVMGNRDSTLAGWRVEVTTSGRLQLVLRDSTTTFTLTEGGAHRVTYGGWGWALIKVDRTAGVATIESSFAAAPTTLSIAGMGSINSTTVFRLGSTTASAAHQRFQIERMVTWTGANAESMTGARLASWWTHGKRLPWMSSYSWLGKGLAPVIEVDNGLGDILAPWSAGQVMLAHHNSITRNPRKLGLLIPRPLQPRLAMTNLADASWATVAGATKVLSDRADPLGYFDATKVIKSGAGGCISRTVDIVQAAQTTASVWVFWDGTNTAPRLRVRDAGDTTTLGEATFAGAINKWSRLSVTYTGTGGADIVQIHPSDPATTVGTAWFSHCQASAGEMPMPLQPDNNSGGFTSEVLIRAFAIGSRRGRGTMRAWWIALEQDVANATEGGSICSLSAAHGTHVHRRSLEVSDTTEEGRGRAYNASGAITATALFTAPSNWATVESQMSIRWDETEVDGFSVRADRNGVSGTASNDLSASLDQPIEALHVGSDPGEIRTLHGILSLLEVWPGYVLPIS